MIGLMRGVIGLGIVVSVGLSSPSQAATVRHEASVLGCHGPHLTVRHGEFCWVTDSMEFEIHRYRHPAQAVRETRYFIEHSWMRRQPRYFVRDGDVLVLPLGPVDPYSLSAARYALRHVGGRLIRV